MELKINGKTHSVSLDTDRNLLSLLRNDLDLTGSKYGCGEGQCGACTVLINGNPVQACITPLHTVAGKEVMTIEGLEKAGHLHPLQEAFLQTDAMQCAFCTPGMIMSGIALLNKNSKPTESEIVEFMDGNICRCGTYPRIISAINKAAAVLEEGSND